MQIICDWKSPNELKLCGACLQQLAHLRNLNKEVISLQWNKADQVHPALYKWNLDLHVQFNTM